MTMKQPEPAFILVRPQMGENIGAAARALLNFGLTDLRLVQPRDGWPNQKAVDTSSGALDHIPSIPVFDTLQNALSDCHFVYATTARHRHMNKTVRNTAGACEHAQSRTHQKIGFVFGPERTGLESEDLALCHEIINIRTNPDFSSLNLGQGVLLLAYEWSKIRGNKNKSVHSHTREIATHNEMSAVLSRLEDTLEHHNFFRAPHLKDNMIRNIRTMLMRAEFDAQEIRTFHGIISALIGHKVHKN